MEPASRQADANPSGRNLVKRRKTEQANICLGTNGLTRSDPTGSRSSW